MIKDRNSFLSEGFNSTFQKIAKERITSINPENYSHIISIKYRDKIKQFNQRFIELTGLKYYAIIITVNNNRYWLSNTANTIAIPYHLHGLHHIDTSIFPENYQGKDHFFPDQIMHDNINFLFRKITEELYGFYTIYTLVKSADESTILLIVGNDSPIATHQEREQLYKNSHEGLEKFSTYFLAQMIDTLVQEDNDLKYARVFYDKDFRNNLLTSTLIKKDYQLSMQERSILQWFSRGKTAIETALIMHLSVHTVREYAKAILKKLDALNIVHAVSKAKDAHII